MTPPAALDPFAGRAANFPGGVLPVAGAFYSPVVGKSAPDGFRLARQPNEDTDIPVDQAQAFLQTPDALTKCASLTASSGGSA